MTIWYQRVCILDSTDDASLENLGLSLADRGCLALAGRLRTEALTTDRSWSQVGSVSVRVIR